MPLGTGSGMKPQELWRAARLSSRLTFTNVTRLSNVTFYEVPMIDGMARLEKWFIDSGMRRGTPRKDHENVITVYGGTEPWKQRLGFESPDAAYLILLDQRGIVRWRHNGGFDEEAHKTLSTHL